MIKANELRIGNYILLNGKLKYVNWRTIRDLRCQSNDDESIYESILLTEEIFSKNGFSYSDLNGDSGFWEIKHPNAAGIIQILSGEEGFTYDFQASIKYVHQLQNLYFVLTGEELKISL